MSKLIAVYENMLGEIGLACEHFLTCLALELFCITMLFLVNCEVRLEAKFLPTNITLKDGV